MIRTLPSASSLRSITHSLPKKALAYGFAATIGSVITTIPAQAAVSTCTFRENDGCVSGNKTLIAGDKIVSGIGGNIGAGVLPEGTTLSLISLGNTFNVLLNFGGSATEFFEGPGSGSLTYTISIDPVLGAGYTFGTVEIDSQHQGSTSIVKSEAGNAFAELTSTDGDPSGPIAIAPGLTTLKVTDAFTVSDDSGLSTFNNLYTQIPPSSVPGPLPLMGAGLAFGWSRKLRARVKASANG